MSSDSNAQPFPDDAPRESDAALDQTSANAAGPAGDSTGSAPSSGAAEAAETTDAETSTGGESPDSPKRRILIGSQRDPAAYRPKPRHEFESNRGRRAKPLRHPPRQGGPRGEPRREGPPGVVSADTLADVPLSESPFMPPVPPGGIVADSDGSTFVIDSSSIPSTEPATTFDAPIPPAARPPLSPPPQPPRAKEPPRPTPPARPQPVAPPRSAPPAPVVPAPVAEAPVLPAPAAETPVVPAPAASAPVVSEPAMPHAYVSPDEPPAETTPAPIAPTDAPAQADAPRSEQRERFDRQGPRGGRGEGGPRRDGGPGREGGQGREGSQGSQGSQGGRRGGFREREEQRRREKEEARATERAEMTVVKRFPTPSVRDRLSPELEAEFLDAVGGMELDALLTGQDSVTSQAVLEPESRHTARVLAVHREDVFVELGGREQGIVSLRLFAEPPKPEEAIDVVVVRFNAEDGLYELTLPNVAASVGDWSQISEGIVVEARVTGHNSGGLECEVNRLRGFIPVSQIALYRVQDLSEFVGQKFNCVVTEANPQRENLVLSRRSVLEREKEEARANLLASLTPGQIFDGVVRKILEFGAFVELGNGVDGLLHISEMGWGRVHHPSDVFHEGQGVRVRINKVDPVTGKISLGYRDLTESPWASAEEKYQPGTPAQGRVVKIMDFGAFVELEPGVEGLVHISELSHKRVARVNDVVKEGDQIDVMILSVDPQSRRISLSMKNLAPPPEEAAKADAAGGEPPAPEEPAKPKKPAGPLKGGLGRSPGGSAFGLKW